jgi:hypothetical protein
MTTLRGRALGFGKIKHAVAVVISLAVAATLGSVTAAAGWNRIAVLGGTTPGTRVENIASRAVGTEDYLCNPNYDSVNRGVIQQSYVDSSTKEFVSLALRS